MSKKHRERLPFCWCCGGPRTSHKRKVCGACRKLGPVELAYRQHQRNIDRTTTWDGFIVRKRRRTFETYLAHPDPRVRAYAVEVKARDEAQRRAWREERMADEAAFERLHDPGTTGEGGAVVWYSSQMPKSAAAETHAATAKPPTMGERPDLGECIAGWREGRDQEALHEAARRYDGDLAAELAAVEAGTHPLQERQRRVRP